MGMDGDRLGTSRLPSCFSALRHLCLVITKCCLEGGLFKNKLEVLCPQAAGSLCLACQRIPALQISCKVRADPLDPLLSCACSCKSSERAHQASSLLNSALQTFAGTSAFYPVMISPPPPKHFPHTQAGLSLSLTNSLSGPTPKGVLMQSNTSPFVLSQLQQAR